FCQAEDGIRAFHVTGVQTCALPISRFCAVRNAARCSRGRVAGSRDSLPGNHTFICEEATMSRFKSVSALVLLLAGGLIAAPEARAQACIGIPAGPGRFALGGSVGFTDGATNYGAGLLANLEGPLSVGANYTLTKIDDVDENFNSFDGILAYE